MGRRMDSTVPRAGHKGISIMEPLERCFHDPSILMTGVVVSLFEGCMYIFVFNWTPSLSAGFKSPPFGFIFATFMVACMGGSSAFSVLSNTFPPETFLVGVFGCGAVALAVPIFTTDTLSVLVAFLVFEACVGVYWPAMGTVKSKVVPEEMRATVYNIYRVPLNMVVLGILLNDMKVSTAFSCCAVMLGVAAFTQSLLAKRLASGRAKGESVAMQNLEAGKLMDEGSE